MPEPTPAPAASAGLDLASFHAVFFEEAGENLDRMEQLLLAADMATIDDEALNSIFRCAHSIKGGAATFGFADAAALTHQMETLLDKLRRRELAGTAAMVDVLLEAGDALRGQLARHQRGGEGDAVDTGSLLARISDLAAGPRAAPAAAPVEATDEPLPPGVRALEMLLGPLASPSIADDVVGLFADVVGLGTIAPLDGGQPADGMRRFAVTTDSDDETLLDLLSFHVSREQVQLLPRRAGYGFHRGAPGAPAEDESFGLFDGAPGAPSRAAGSTPAAGADPAAPPRPRAAAAAAAPEATTLRVSVEKVDQLINLVGELVITQAMLAQTSAGIDPAAQRQLAAGLADLSRHTRDLQESVMSIRMIPMSVVFNRFPRMLRDLAGKLGKQVEFVTHGEATELDKGLIEKITDPLTHLVRNACDHGVELPAARRAAGKAETGTISLSASHQGGSVVIEVRDDGRGLSRPKLLAKARERGIDAPDTLTDAEVWSLIFAPGFSTAEIVTDVSGRGVGMDVVKRNIAALSGSVEIESSEGFGMSVRVRLPLTLAIMDGMSVSVGAESYILPIASVIEAFQIGAGTMRSIGGSGRVVQVRGEYMPVIALEEAFSVPRATPLEGDPVMVVVESEGRRVAILVDELLGQQQVVVKNLEANYRRVSDVSGATILGDGRVALILDVTALTRRARH